MTARLPLFQQPFNVALLVVPNPIRPTTAKRVTTYSELAAWIQAFAAGRLNFFILLGSAGLQKSREMRDAVGTSAGWIQGHASAFGMFSELFKHRDELVVIDDVDSLYSDRDAVRLLKSLCQTDPRKRLTWQSHSPSLVKANIPNDFTTSSKVALIANAWNSLNPNVIALEDRAHVVSFEPSALEVHSRVALWFWDQEVFDFIAERLHLIPRPSMRHYVRAAEEKDAQLDWRATFLERCGLTDNRLLVAQLLADHSFPTAAARVAAFVKRSGLSSATFYNQSKQLQPAASVPHFQLSSPKPALEPESIIDLLRRRHGRLGSG